MKLSEVLKRRRREAIARARRPELRERERLVAAIRRRVDQHNASALELFKAGRYEDACSEWKRGYRLAGDLRPGEEPSGEPPSRYRCLSNCGVAYIAMGQHAEAETCYRAAIDLDPRWPHGWDNLGALYWTAARYEEAIECHRQALAIAPGSINPTKNMASSLECLGRTAEALDCFREVLRLRPDDVEARVGVGLARLTLGDLAGMADLDARLERMKHLEERVPGVPIWDGRPIDGTLVVNQRLDGFGDCIQGIRSAAAIRERVGRLVVYCRPAIASLMARVAGVDAVVTDLADLPGDVEAQAPALGLPWHDGAARRADWTLGREVPYLSIEEDWRDFWREQISHVRGFRIGVVWQGDPNHGNDRRRSFRVEQFAPLAAIPGVSLISLQKGVGHDQLAAAPFPVEDMMAMPAYDEGDLQDTGAVMQSLDLVIAPDTGLAHLAGGLGLPVWIAIPFVPEWRWLRERTDSPWYPTARLFRQPAEGEWPAVFRAMAGALTASLASGCAAAAPAPDPRSP